MSQIHLLSNMHLKSDPALKKWLLATQLVNKIIKQKIWNYLLPVNLPPGAHRLVKELDEFVNHVGDALQQDMQNRVDLVLTHNDLKPKNILWSSSGNPFIIDWEAAGYMPIATDYVDTLLGWCLEASAEQLKLNTEKVKVFKAAYKKGFPLISISNDSINIVVAKWLVWLAFCINQIVQQANEKEYLAFTMEALRILQFLKNHYTQLPNLA